MEVIMKITIKRTAIILLSTTLLALTGCNQVKMGFFSSSKDDVSSIEDIDYSDEDDIDDYDDDIETEDDSLNEDNNKNSSKDKSKNNKEDKSQSKTGEKSSDGKDNNSSNNEAKANDTTDKKDVSSANPTPTQAPIQPNANKDLQVYTVNSITAEIEPVTALVPQNSKITAQLVVDTVVESLADQSIIIKVDSVTTEDDKIIVSFDKDKAPYSDMGSGYEAAILDAIAQSLIDNLKEYKKVIYRIENNAYVSGVFEYGINEAYLGDN